MTKFIEDRRQGVKIYQPNPLVSPEQTLKFDYIVLSAMLCLDEHFIVRMKLREQGWSDADAKSQREEIYRSAELSALHKYAIEYHMQVVRTHPAFHLAFLKASEFARMLIRKREEADTKKEEESEERKRAAMRIADEESRRKVKLHMINENQVDPSEYLDNINRFRPIGLSARDSAGIDSFTSLPNPVLHDESPNVNDYVWGEIMWTAITPESWPEVDEDFTGEDLCVETINRALSADGCHAAKQTSNIWTSFHAWMKHASRRMKDPPSDARWS